MMVVKRTSWLILIIALAFPTLGTLLYFVLADTKDGNTRTFRMTYPVVKVVQFVFPVLYIWWTKAERLEQIRWSTSGARGGIVMGLLTAVLMITVYCMGFRGGAVFEGVAVVVRAKVQGFGVSSPGTYALLVVFIAVVHSFLEEYYWRWFVFAELKERLTMTWSLLISSAGFMAHHVVVLHIYFPQHFLRATLPFALAVGVGGALWAWWYARTQSLAGAWLAHIGADVGLMAVGYDLLYR